MDLKTELVAKFSLLSGVGKLILWSENLMSESELINRTFEWYRDKFDRNFEISSSETESIKNLLIKAKELIDDGSESPSGFNALKSPFVSIFDRKNYKNAYYIPYELLPQLQIPSVNNDTYRKILSNFEQDFTKICSNYSVNGLLMLFEKHLSNIPFSHSTNDISLYKYCSFLSGCSTSLYLYLHDKFGDLWHDHIWNLSSSDYPFLIILGDISGIQKFIYTISSKGALRSLKGRSFFLELFTEHVIDELITKLGLTRTNLLSHAGGNFTILAPNTEKSKSTILSVKESARDYLFKEFAGELYLHLEYAEVGIEEFVESDKVYAKVREKIEHSKLNKWISKLEDLIKPSMPHESCLTNQCEVCFREDVDIKPKRVGASEITICSGCYHQYLLGTELFEISTGAKPVIYKLKQKPPNEDYIEIEGTFYCFRRNKKDALEKIADRIFRLNSFDVSDYENPKAVLLSIGLYREPGLRELEEVSDVFGMSRIAVLRADVDNLGKIFNSLSGKDSMLRRIEISWRLGKFFRYHLNGIVQGDIKEPFYFVERGGRQRQRKLMIVYSGGDDLFIVGNWLDVIEASWDIRRYFELYTGSESMTISTGIAINHEDYPIYQFAKDSKSLESLAKTGSKNSVALFHMKRLNWSDFERVIERTRFFVQFLNKEKDHLSTDTRKLPKSFFYRLLALSRKFNEEGITILPKSAYLVSRIKAEGIAPDRILKLKEIVMNSNPEEWTITEIATMLILMLMRKGGN